MATRRAGLGVAVVKGLSELILFGALLAAAWSRTPAGAVGHNLLVRWQGGEAVDVLARFRTGPPPGLEEAIAAALTVPPPVRVRDAPMPGVSVALRARLSEADAEAIEALLNENDLETALERHLIGEPLRQRAIRRARAAGAAQPEQYTSHRAYLPAQAAAEVDALRGEIPPMATALSLLWPVSVSARISSPFGYRIHPTLKTRTLHNGVDIAVPSGTPVHAAGSGSVRSAAENGVSGRYVVLDHGHGVTTSYAHGDVLHVSRRDTVGAGELIMDSGSTGRSTGPHLHFILKINGTAIDPLPFRLTRPERSTAAPSAPGLAATAPQ